MKDSSTITYSAGDARDIMFRTDVLNAKSLLKRHITYKFPDMHFSVTGATKGWVCADGEMEGYLTVAFLKKDLEAERFEKFISTKTYRLADIDFMYSPEKIEHTDILLGMQIFTESFNCYKFMIRRNRSAYTHLVDKGVKVLPIEDLSNRLGMY